MSSTTRAAAIGPTRTPIASSLMWKEIGEELTKKTTRSDQRDSGASVNDSPKQPTPRAALT